MSLDRDQIAFFDFICQYLFNFQYIAFGAASLKNASNIIDKAKRWISNPSIDGDSRREILDLLEDRKIQELEARFYPELTFGTGGLRLLIGAGTNRINFYTIKKASFALAKEILKYGRGTVAISYDSRKFSLEFAKTSASVLADSGITVFFYRSMKPVPLLSYAIRHLKASAGIMITASHNPPEYNGFKVYWSDGQQITPPQDQSIVDFYHGIQDEDHIPYMTFEEGLEKTYIRWIERDVEDSYYLKLKETCLRPQMCTQRGINLKIAYTPIHGTGLIPCTRGLKQMGFSDVIVVEEQADGNPNFPTVRSPNPEDPAALQLCVDLMLSSKADIALGSDSDADRIALATLFKGEVHFFNGHQVGLLMLHYILVTLEEQGRLKKNSYFIKSVVTTDLQRIIAEHFDVRTEETLTGFKWICHRLNTIQENEPKRNFLFATEESCGHLNHDFIRDKDGIASVTLLAEIALYHKERGLNLVEVLDQIFLRYGHSFESLFQIDLPSRHMEKIMSSYGGERSSIANFKIRALSDYRTLTHFDLSTKKTSHIKNFPNSDLLAFFLDGGHKLYIRPSGTESKIKFYTMIYEAEGSLEEKKERALVKSDRIVAHIKEHVAKVSP